MNVALATSRPDGNARVDESRQDALRLWMRLLTCTGTIERVVRKRLRERHATTLPRFDLLAQLDRAPGGLRMGELSRRLMVTGGNVTGLVAQLVAEGMVERAAETGDRRAYVVCLTPLGREAFRRMAVDHEGWIVELTSGMGAPDRSRLHALLGSLKATVHAMDAQDAADAGEHPIAAPPQLAAKVARL